MRELRVGGSGMPPGLLLAVLGPAFVLILAATAQRAVEGYQMARQVEVARREVAELRQQNVELQERIARYRSDAYVEKIAREQGFGGDERASVDDGPYEHQRLRLALTAAAHPAVAGLDRRDDSALPRSGQFPPGPARRCAATAPAPAPCFP